MKIELPLETWTELFGFVPRSQLIQLVLHIGKKLKRNRRRRKCQQTIEDRQFVSFVQFFLHKCGEVTLGRLRIRLSRNGNEPIVIVNGKNEELPLAGVPIPENVKNFKSIRISNFFGKSVIAFLQEFRRNSLLDNVNLKFHYCPDFLFQIMTNFMPLFTNINSIGISNHNSDILVQLQNGYSELATPMLTSARLLLSDNNCRYSWFCDWLRIPREDGKPRVLILCGDKIHGRSVSRFIKHIKKDFLKANQAVSFFVSLDFFPLHDVVSVQSLTLENGPTQEKMVIQKANKSYGPVVTISRYPMGTNEKEWTEEMSHHPNIGNRRIEFSAH